MCTLGFELIRHVLAAHVCETLVPGCSNCQASREHARVGRLANGKRTILQAETGEAQTFDWADVAYAGTWHTRELVTAVLLGFLNLVPAVPVTICAFSSSVSCATNALAWAKADPHSRPVALAGLH